MASMMDYMWSGNNGYGYGFPFFNGSIMLIWLVVFIIIGYLVYRDANSRGMNGLLWFILVILPMIGVLFLVIYVIIRFTCQQKCESNRPAIEILKERYARGELSEEQFEKMSAELKK